MTTVEDSGCTSPDDDELLAGLHRSVARATLSTSLAEVGAMGRRTRRRRRAVEAGIGTGAAALVAAVAVLASATGTAPGTASARGATAATGSRPAPGQTLDIQDAGFSLSTKGDGKITLSLRDMFDPDKVQRALASIGIASRVERITVPPDWDSRKPYCQVLKSYFGDPDAFGVFSQPSRSATNDFEHVVTIDAARLPAGDIILLSLVTSPSTGGPSSTMVVFKHDPGPCVPTSKSVKVQ